MDRVVPIGKDGRCMCTCADPCPLHRSGMSYRCTKEELEAAGIKTETAPPPPPPKPWIWNPKVKGSGIIECIPQTGLCPNGCEDCFYQSGRSYLEPLDKNLPHIPSIAMAFDRIVRVNDGNDSNVERDLVERVATGSLYRDFFFNTSMPIRLAEFPGPFVLTVNPGKMTDTSFHRLDTAPPNMMFARVRVNMWNLESVVKPAVWDYAGRLHVPVVLTFMAYYSTPVKAGFENAYHWERRTINPYWILKRERIDEIEKIFWDMDTVHLCGRHGHSLCKDCGNCLREYYAAKERMRAINETKPKEDV